MASQCQDDPTVPRARAAPTGNGGTVRGASGASTGGPVWPNQRPGARIAVNIVFDGIVSALAAPVARYLADPHGGLLHPLWFVAGGAITLLVSGVPFRMPQQYWRFSGVADLVSIAGASAASAALFAAGLWATGYPLPTPTFPIIHALVLLVSLGSVRMASRLAARRRRSVARRRIVLAGPDLAADLFLRALERDPEGSEVVGLLTEGARQAGRRIHGVPILGVLSDLDQVLSRLAQVQRTPDLVVLTDPDLRGAGLAAVLEAAQRRGIAVQRTPSLMTLTPADRVELRPVAIEDLLNRPQVPLDREGISRMIAGSVVLVTGAGGTIGSELARQIAAFQPERLLLLDHGEFALWQIDLEISEQSPEVDRVALIADVRDRTRIAALFAQYRPELVFHAAALKHVPIVENNPFEGILTNVIGSRIVADCARAAGARAMVLISTDKAVNPSSLMGASKRCAEIYCQALDKRARAEGGQDMRCVTVRFGNVLGSTGSVVPLFRRQLERGGPLTVTHPDMTRYFMTVPEAVGLVLQAARRGTVAVASEQGAGTEAILRNGGIFVLDMGEPVRILDLARQMIRLAGLRPDEDIAITITGLRPGEKLFEELFHGREAPVPTDAAGLRIARPRTVDLLEAETLLDRLATVCHAEDLDRALAILRDLVPEFAHNPGGVVTPPPSRPHAASPAAHEPIA